MKSAEEWLKEVGFGKCFDPYYLEKQKGLITAIQTDAMNAERSRSEKFRKALKKISEAWVEVFGKKVPIEYCKSVRDIAEQALKETA